MDQRTAVGGSPVRFPRHGPDGRFLPDYRRDYPEGLVLLAVLYNQHSWTPHGMLRNCVRPSPPTIRSHHRWVGRRHAVGQPIPSGIGPRTSHQNDRGPRACRLRAASILPSMPLGRAHLFSSKRETPALGGAKCVRCGGGRGVGGTVPRVWLEPIAKRDRPKGRPWDALPAGPMLQPNNVSVFRDLQRCFARHSGRRKAFRRGVSTVDGAHRPPIPLSNGSGARFCFFTDRDLGGRPPVLLDCPAPPRRA